MTARSGSRVVVLMPTWIGDICMATPALQAMRDAAPDATITAAVRPGKACLLEEHPALDGLVEIDPRGVRGPWRAGRTLAGLSPDTVYVLPNSFRSALTARISGAHRRVGFRRDGRSWLLSDTVTRLDTDRPVSAVTSYMHLVTGADTPAGPLHMRVTDSDCTEAAEVLGDSADPYVVLVPGANRPDKRWPASRFAALADRLHAAYGWRVLVSGAPGERDVTAAVIAEMRAPGSDLAATGISLSALKAIIDAAEVVVSNDTGPRHIAAALGTAVVALFGPTDQRWACSDHAREMRLLSAPFLPEELTADAVADCCGMDRIAVEDVLHAVHTLHARTR